MKMTRSLAEILELSVPERIQLVEDIWDSVSEAPEAVVLTEEQGRELDRRLEAYRLNPQQGSPWEEVKERIRKNL
jgi:putative addiction module component (TIGR02574 family)